MSAFSGGSSQPGSNVVSIGTGAVRREPLPSIATVANFHGGDYIMKNIRSLPQSGYKAVYELVDYPQARNNQSYFDGTTYPKNVVKHQDATDSSIGAYLGYPAKYDFRFGFCVRFWAIF